MCWPEPPLPGSSPSPLYGVGGSCSTSAYTEDVLGTAAQELEVRLDGYHTQCSCCQHPLGLKGWSCFEIPDLVVTASGQTGPVGVQFSVDLYAETVVAYDCSNCAANNWEPSLPVASATAVFGFGIDTETIGPIGDGWTSGVWSGQLVIGQAATWNVCAESFVGLGIGRQCQESWGTAHSLALVGGPNPDGSFGPVFSFPDCPTCTANAPSIGLVNNYLLPAGCPGDLDNDGSATVLDFGVLSGNFGRTDLFPGAGGDMDYDGDCDVLDFGAFAADFGCGV